jgi:hypothetical protein
VDGLLDLAGDVDEVHAGGNVEGEVNGLGLHWDLLLSF